MEYKIDEMYNTIIIKLSGKLLGGSFSEEFNSVLHRFLAEGKNNIIVEMSGVSFYEQFRSWNTNKRTVHNEKK